MRYLPAVPSKFVCAKLQTFKGNSVLYARAAHVTTRAAYIFHARWVILRGVDSAPHSRERAGNRDAQSHDPKRSKQIKIIKQNSPRIVESWTAPVVSDKPWSVVDGGGGVNLYFYHLGTTTSVLSMEDVDN